MDVFKFFAHSYGMFFSILLKCCFSLFDQFLAKVGGNNIFLFSLVSFRVPKNTKSDSDDVFLCSELKKKKNEQKL